MLSIIVPVYHEKKLDLFLENLLSLIRQNDEIIVIDGDKENSSIKNVNTKDERLQLVYSEKNGRSMQMNYGYSLSKGDNLFFLHCDSILPNNFISLLENVKSDAAAFKLKLDKKNILLSFFCLITNIRSKISKTPYGDQGFYVKRSIFEAVGKFKEYKFLEDVIMMDTLKSQGYSIEIINDYIISSAKRWEKYGVIKNTINNRKIISLYYKKGISPDELVKMYYK